MIKELTIATNYDDWEGLYVDGKLVYEGHKIRYQDIFEVLGIKVKEIQACNYLENFGSLPDKLEELEPDNDDTR